MYDNDANALKGQHKMCDLIVRITHINVSITAKTSIKVEFLMLQNSLTKLLGKDNASHSLRIR